MLNSSPKCVMVKVASVERRAGQGSESIAASRRDNQQASSRLLMIIPITNTEIVGADNANGAANNGPYWSVIVLAYT